MWLMSLTWCVSGVLGGGLAELDLRGWHCCCHGVQAMLVERAAAERDAYKLSAQEAQARAQVGNPTWRLAPEQLPRPLEEAAPDRLEDTWAA